jgi:hypothetical protein
MLAVIVDLMFCDVLFVPFPELLIECLGACPAVPWLRQPHHARDEDAVAKPAPPFDSGALEGQTSRQSLLFMQFGLRSRRKREFHIHTTGKRIGSDDPYSPKSGLLLIKFRLLVLSAML